MMTNSANSVTNAEMNNSGLKIYFDGGCRPNPGQMETAVVARSVTYHRTDCGQGNNNDAEWLALIHAAETALSIGATDVIFLGDSAVVVGQANGAAKCRSAGLQGHLKVFLTLKQKFHRVRIRRISRFQNLAGIALTKTRI
jgi:ribonuclease HI